MINDSFLSFPLTLLSACGWFTHESECTVRSVCLVWSPSLIKQDLEELLQVTEANLFLPPGKTPFPLQIIANTLWHRKKSETYPVIFVPLSLFMAISRDCLGKQSEGESTGFKEQARDPKRTKKQQCKMRATPGNGTVVKRSFWEGGRELESSDNDI